MDKKGWNNHENTNEEMIRRKLIKLEKEVRILREDLNQATKTYYKIIKKLKHNYNVDKNES
tara:strand:- start:203 stop:385 length:183 start_codon:yes stop_codon:yes gene_type:complete